MSKVSWLLVRDALRSFTLERVLQLAIVATIVSAVLAAGSILEWVGPARKLRWVALFALVVVALVLAARARRRWALSPAYLVAASFVGLAFVSSAWSAFPRLTVSRAAALALVLLAACALALWATGRPRATEIVLEGVVGGTIAVAIGGLIVLATASDRAVQHATSVSPARYQGLGGGPNTATMVMAVAVPLAAHLAFRNRGATKVAALGAFVLLLGSIVASGSRGALAGAFVGLLVYALLGTEHLRQRGAAAAGVLLLLLVSAMLMRVPQPDLNAPALPSGMPDTNVASQFGPRPRDPQYVDPALVPRMQDEIGQPPLGVADTERRPRRLVGTSGRTEGWRGALEQASERPLLGFGFGTEDQVFVDRYVGFNSNVAENSYLGLFLQLGLLGVATFLVLIGTLVRSTARALPVTRGAERRLVATCAGALAAGLVLACVQSFIYAPGNNATVAVWLSAFPLVAAGRPR